MTEEQQEKNQHLAPQFSQPSQEKVKDPSPEEIKRAESEEIEKHSKELWLTKQFIDRPIIVMIVIIIAVIISIAISIALEGFKQTEASDREYLIWEDERVENLDLFFLMREKFMQGQSGSGSQIPERSQEQIDWATSIIMKSDDEDNEDTFNVLTVDNIKAYMEAEQKILNHKRFKEFCLSNGQDGNCSDNVFGSFTKELGPASELTQAKLDAKLTEIVQDEDKFNQWKGLFGRNFGENGSIKSNLLRNSIKFGGPLKDGDHIYQDIFDEEVEQRKIYEEFVEIMLDICRDQISKPSGLRVVPTNKVIVDYETLNVVATDFLFAFGSITFVWLYIAFHLRSIFLASMGMLNILYSFPLTMVIFNGIFQIDYFSTLHVIVIFIVLGIAADNIFVFTDAWNQSGQSDKLAGNYGKRMAYTFRRASRAMLATSSTTGAAFLATGLSEIMPISSFGFFAGILIPMNFVLVITYYPASLMVYEYYTKNMCQCKKKKEKVSRSENNDPESQQQQQEIREIKEEHPIEKFFNNQVNNFVFKTKYIQFVLFAIWLGIAVWRASLLPGLSEQVSFLPSDYDVQDTKDALLNGFHMAGNSDQGIKVYQFWGVDSIGKEGVSRWDPFNRGQVHWDETFNLAKNQQYFFDYCKRMEEHKIVQDGQIITFIYAFKQFLTDKSKTFPLPEAEFIPELKLFVETNVGSIYYNNNMIGLIGDELKYVSIRLASHGRPFSPDKEIRPFYDEWEDHVAEENKKAPEGFKGSKQTALLYWVFMVTEKALVTNAIQGILISMAFAFVVLVLTSHNLIISFYSVLCIGGIVISVVAIIEIVGWELGVSESVAIVILIGLSVDYVVHLANHYVECVYNDRFRKTQVALRDLGISIVAGASTTLGSSLFLYFATITLFNKFAILIYVTILFSLLFSIGLFSGLMHAFGPENGLGDISKLCAKKNKEPKNAKAEQTKEIEIENKEKQYQDNNLQIKQQEIALADNNNNNQNEEQQVEVIEAS